MLEAKGPRGKPVSVALPLAGLAAGYDGDQAIPKHIKKLGSSCKKRYAGGAE